MRNLSLFIVLMFLINSCSFNIEKKLSAEQLDSLKNGNVIYYYFKPKHINRMRIDDLEGFYKVKYINGRVISYPIGNWYGDAVGENNFKTVAKFDSIGFMYKYYELYDNDKLRCDWDYKSDTINNKTYSIENHLSYYPNGMINVKGTRYYRIEMKDGHIEYIDGSTEFGQWIFYKNNGDIDYIKDYGKIK